jgi:hypothetical protein
MQWLPLGSTRARAVRWLLAAMTVLLASARHGRCAAQALPALWREPVVAVTLTGHQASQRSPPAAMTRARCTHSLRDSWI